MDVVLHQEMRVVETLSRVMGARGRLAPPTHGGEGWGMLQEGTDGYDDETEAVCRQVDELSTDEDPYGACETVRTKCKPARALFNYLELSYCLLPTARWASALLLLAWIAVLFLWLTAMVDFLVPSLAVMAEACGLKESVAGVTFLALGNGSSDIFSMTAATMSGSRGMRLTMGEIFGNGMFVFVLIQGVVALVAPFTVDPAEYCRDCAFYLTSIAFVTFVMWDGEFYIWEGVLLLGVYAAYIAVVLRFDDVRAALGLGPPAGAADATDAGGDGVGKGEGEGENVALLSSDRYAIYAGRVDPSEPSAHAQMAQFLHPVPADIDYLPAHDRILEFVKIPAILLLKLSVPVVDRGLPSSGWSRPIASVQAAVAPPVVCSFVYLHTLPSWCYRPAVFLSVFGGALALGLALALGVWYATESGKPPRNHHVLAYVGFAMSVLWIYATSEEIVNVILAFGTVFDVGQTVLGITILAVGIGMQDLVTNVGVARAGLARMAAVACVGAPLLNMLLGLGIAAIAGNLVVAAPYPMPMSQQLVMCIMFLAGSVVVALLVLAASDFRGGAVFGITMVSLYVAFIGVCMVNQAFFQDTNLVPAQ